MYIYKFKTEKKYYIFKSQYIMEFRKYVEVKHMHKRWEKMVIYYYKGHTTYVMCNLKTDFDKLKTYKF